MDLIDIMNTKCQQNAYLDFPTLLYRSYLAQLLTPTISVLVSLTVLLGSAHTDFEDHDSLSLTKCIGCLPLALNYFCDVTLSSTFDESYEHHVPQTCHLKSFFHWHSTIYSNDYPFSNDRCPLASSPETCC